MPAPEKIDVEEIIKGSSLGRDAWARLRKNHLAMASLWFFVAIVLISFVVPLIPKIPGLPAIPDPDLTHPSLKSLGAFSKGVSLEGDEVFYLLGSDQLGRDIFSRIIHGGQVSLTVGFIATAVSLTIGILYGAFSGYVGGKVDSAMMRFVDILYALPFMIIVIILTTFFGNKLWLLFVCIGAVEWLTMARIVRGMVMSLKQQDFIEAVRSLGISRWRIICRHLIPNTLGPVIVYTTLTVPAVMRLEAILSFLGLGVQPPKASWGSLIKEGADRMASDPALLIFPALVFGLTLFSLNFLGDGLRDALDPKSSKD
ncbi:MAG: ABC transporter permease [Methylococcales bacterium]|nr:ABC transporter permease [Methylococcales bacterium]